MNLRDDLTALNQNQHLFGKKVLQSHAAFLVYEKLLYANKNSINWICEIGTATGILAVYFGLWGKLNKTPVMTMDNGAADWAWPLEEKTIDILQLLEVRVLRADCFGAGGMTAILQFTRGESGLLFCDGGKKGKELQTFGPQIPLGSIIVVHDWPKEVTPVDVKATPEVTFFEPWHTQSIQLHTKAAIFRRI